MMIMFRMVFFLFRLHTHPELLGPFWAREFAVAHRDIDDDSVRLHFSGSDSGSTKKTRWSYYDSYIETSSQSLMIGIVLVDSIVMLANIASSYL